MARPLKDGVDYFPKDTDFYSDDKVKLLKVEFGAKGMYLLDYLLCYLYGKNGYFLSWDEDTCFLVSEGAGCGCGPEFIREFITGCFRRSFFDKGVFDTFGVITSSGIQRRYIRMFNSRETISIIQEYWLLDVDDRQDVPASVLKKLTFKRLKSTENPDKSTENPDKSTVNPQSKKKVNKKEIKEKPNKVADAPCVSVDSIFSGYANGNDQLYHALNDFQAMRKKMKKPLTERAAQMIINELIKLYQSGNPPVQVLEQSILHCWQGVFELKGDRNRGETSQPEGASGKLSGTGGKYGHYV